MIAMITSAEKNIAVTEEKERALKEINKTRA